MTRSGTTQWLNRAILALLGIILMLLGTGILALGLQRAPFQSLEQIVVLGVAVALIAVGLRQVVRAVTGRLPSWYPDFLFNVWR